jgi:DNA-binding transcriptional MerR regulator
MSEEPKYTIGKVVKRLQVNHPDLSVSKLRFLEAEGLVNPTRTKSGYRMYSDRDIARVEAVLQMQKTNFYPLSVIKEKLDSAPEGFFEQLEAGGAVEDIKSQDDLFASTRHSIDEMATEAGVTASFVSELIEAGFLDTEPDGMNRPSISGADLQLVKSASELVGYGFDLRTLKSHIQRANRDVFFYKQGLAVAARKANDEDPASTLEHLIDLNDTITRTLIRRMANQ